jgi:hypothetical protein
MTPYFQQQWPLSPLYRSTCKGYKSPSQYPQWKRATRPHNSQALLGVATKPCFPLHASAWKGRNSRTGLGGTWPGAGPLLATEDYEPGFLQALQAQCWPEVVRAQVQVQYLGLLGPRAVQSWPSSWAPAEHVGYVPHWDAGQGQLGRTSHCRAGWPLLKLSKLPAQPLLASLPALHTRMLGSTVGVLSHLSVSLFVGSPPRCGRLSTPGLPRATCLLPGAGEPPRPYLPNFLLPPSSSLAEREHASAQRIAYASHPGCNLAPSGCCCRQDHNK